MVDIYCLKCRAHTPNVEENVETITVKGKPRSIFKAVCSVCGKKKNMFLKYKDITK